MNKNKKKKNPHNNKTNGLSLSQTFTWNCKCTYIYIMPWRVCGVCAAACIDERLYIFICSDYTAHYYLIVM